MLCSPLTAAVQSLARERMNSANIPGLDDERVVRKEASISSASCRTVDLPHSPAE